MITKLRFPLLMKRSINANISNSKIVHMNQKYKRRQATQFSSCWFKRLFVISIFTLTLSKYFYYLSLF